MIDKIVPILESAVTMHDVKDYYELFGGGARMLLNLNPLLFRKRVYNEVDLSLCNLFACMTRADLLFDLQELLYKRGYGEDTFFKSKSDNELGFGTPIEQASNAFILTHQSRAAGMVRQNHTAVKERYYFSKIRKLSNFLGVMEGVKVLNNDYYSVLKEVQYDGNSLLYLDPPYIPDTMALEGTYSTSFTMDDHILLVDRIIKSKCKILLSGYDHEIYNRLNTNNGWTKILIAEVPVYSSASSTSGVRWAKEYIWTNFKIADNILNKIGAQVVDWM